MVIDHYADPKQWKHNNVHPKSEKDVLFVLMFFLNERERPGSKSLSCVHSSSALRCSLVDDSKDQPSLLTVGCK